MTSKHVIFLRWKLTGRIECFTTLSKVFDIYDSDILGISIHSLYKKKLLDGWSNDYIEVVKVKVN
jgi:hypothetical protein